MSEYVQGVWLLIYFFVALCIELDSLNCRYIPSKSLCCCCGVVFFNPLTPICDQDRISPYNISTISSRQVMGIKRNINLGIKLIQYQILKSRLTRNTRQTEGRITIKILAVEGLIFGLLTSHNT